MSAPNQGRQSPDPERQTDAQKAAPATDVNKQGQEPEGGAAEASKDQLKDLESNPKHILQDEAEKKTGKTT